VVVVAVVVVEARTTVVAGVVMVGARKVVVTDRGPAGAAFEDADPQPASSITVVTAIAPIQRMRLRALRTLMHISRLLRGTPKGYTETLRRPERRERISFRDATVRPSA